MSRVESTRVTAQPGTVRSCSAVIRSHMTPSESLQVGMTQYRTSHESGVTLLLSSHQSSVTSHGSRKETVWVTSRFRDITSLLTSDVQGLVANLDRRLAQHLVLVLVVRVDFTSLPFDAFGMQPPAPCLEMSSTPA
jgi:hypothetical protein